MSKAAYTLMYLGSPSLKVVSSAAAVARAAGRSFSRRSVQEFSW